MRYLSVKGMISLVWILSALSMVSGVEPQRRIRVIRGEVKNMLIFIDPSIAEDARTKVSLQTLLDYLADALANSLQLTLKSATVVLPVTWSDDMTSHIATAWETVTKGDVWVLPGNVSSPLGPGVRAMGAMGCGKPGRHVQLSAHILQHLEPWHGKLLAAGLLQLVFGVYPETPLGAPHFTDITGDSHPVTCPRDAEGEFIDSEGNPCEQGTLGCLLNPLRTSASIMTPALRYRNVAEVCGGPDTKLPEKRHDPRAPTVHNEACFRRSVRDVITQHPDLNGALPEVKPTVRQVAVQYVKQTTSQRVVLVLEDTIEEETRMRVGRQLYTDYVTSRSADTTSLTLIRVCDSARMMAPQEVGAALWGWAAGQGVSRGCRAHLAAAPPGTVPAAALGKAVKLIQNNMTFVPGVPVTIVFVTNGVQDLVNLPPSYRAYLTAAVGHRQAVLHVVLTSRGGEDALLVEDARRYSGRVVVVGGEGSVGGLGLLPSATSSTVTLLTKEAMKLSPNAKITIPFSAPGGGRLLLALSTPSDQPCPSLQVALHCGISDSTSGSTCTQQGALRNLALLMMHLDINQDSSCVLSLQNNGTEQTEVSFSVSLSADRSVTSLPEIDLFKTHVDDKGGIMPQIISLDVTQDGAIIPGVKVSAKFTVWSGRANVQEFQVDFVETKEGAPWRVSGQYWAHGPQVAQDAVVTVDCRITLPDKGHGAIRSRRSVTSLLKELHVWDSYHTTATTSSRPVFDPEITDLHEVSRQVESNSVIWRLSFTLFTLPGADTSQYKELEFRYGLSEDPDHLLGKFHDQEIGLCTSEMSVTTGGAIYLECTLDTLPRQREQRYLAVQMKDHSDDTWGPMSNSVLVIVPENEDENNKPIPITTVRIIVYSISGVACFFILLATIVCLVKRYRKWHAKQQQMRVDANRYNVIQTLYKTGIAVISKKQNISPNGYNPSHQDQYQSNSDRFSHCEVETKCHQHATQSIPTCANYRAPSKPHKYIQHVAEDNADWDSSSTDTVFVDM